MTATSLIINTDLWQRAKVEAIKRKITLSKLVEISLQNEIDKYQ